MGDTMSRQAGEADAVPPEVVLRIFSFLTGRDVLLGAALTCKSWHNLAQDEHLWKRLCKRDVQWTILDEIAATGTAGSIQYREEFIGAWPRGYSWQWIWRAQNATISPTGYTGIGFASNKATESSKVWEYAGEWRDGERHGFGKCLWSNGTWYLGEWDKEMRHGQGKIVWKAGGSYEGAWKSGHQDGLGTLITRNGFTFHGNWDKNELNGEGTKTWYEKGKLEIYRGNFTKTRANGYGHREYGSGAKYDGYYEMDRRVGWGMYTWPSGHVFCGEWKIGRLRGRLICPDGREFEQEWHEDKMRPDMIHAEREREVLDDGRKVRDAQAWLEERKGLRAVAEKSS